MMYFVKQVADMLQVGIGLVKGFVDSGQLNAIDVSLKRARYGFELATVVDQTG